MGNALREAFETFDILFADCGRIIPTAIYGIQHLLDHGSSFEKASSLNADTMIGRSV